MDKILIELFIPLLDANGNPFPEDWHRGISDQLNERFGGVTIYQRAPATGMWKQSKEHTETDKLVIFEVIADELELAYWKPFKKQLEEQFVQESILIRSSAVQIL